MLRLEVIQLKISEKLNIFSIKKIFMINVAAFSSASLFSSFDYICHIKLVFFKYIFNLFYSNALCFPQLASTLLQWQLWWRHDFFIFSLFASSTVFEVRSDFKNYNSGKHQKDQQKFHHFTLSKRLAQLIN